MPDRRDNKSDYWLKRFGGIAKSIPEYFGIADGGKYRHDKSGYWNKQHGRVKTPPTVKPPVDKPVEPPPAPPVGDLVLTPGQLVFYKHDGRARLVWSERLQKWMGGLPQTAQAYSKFFKPMTAEMIVLWRSALKVLNPNMSQIEFERGWDGLTRSNAGFNNGNGTDTDHFKIECGVFCPGATLRVVDGVVYRKAGVLWVDVYAFDLTVGGELVGFLMDIMEPFPAFFFPNAAPTDDKVTPFPNFGGRCVVPIFYPGGRMPVRYERLVAVAKPVNPFVPARPDITAGVI